METTTTSSENFSTDSLLNLSGKHLISHPETFCFKEPKDSGLWHLKPGLVLPREICELLLTLLQEKNHKLVDDNFINIFKDLERTRLKRVNLRYSKVSDDGLNVLLSHRLVELDISDCSKLTEKTLENINKSGELLNVLVIAGNKTAQKILPTSVFMDSDPTLYPSLREFILKTPSLREFILKTPNLQKFLDISQDKKTCEIFKFPDQVLSKLVTSLPNLISLDISGTNLDGKGQFNNNYYDTDADKIKMCDIKGLQSRVEKPLEFLGLYNTHNDACHRSHIPARVVSGTKNGEQIIAAISAYLEKPIWLQQLINKLVNFIKSKKCHDQKRALNLIILSMMKYGDQIKIQQHGSNNGHLLFFFHKSAYMYFILKNEDYKITYGERQKMIDVLIDAMEIYFDDRYVSHNFFLVLYKFKKLKDIDIYQYRRLVLYLLQILDRSGRYYGSDFYEDVMDLLIYFVRKADVERKKILEDLGIIKGMLNLVDIMLMRHRQRQNSNNKIHLYVTTDHNMLEKALLILLRITNNTPINCHRLLDVQDINYFQSCIKVILNNIKRMDYIHAASVIHKIIGIIGNIAEVKELRCRLMTSDLLTLFEDILVDADLFPFLHIIPAIYIIEASMRYMTAGIISHIASDGSKAWTIDHPTRNEVLDKMVARIDKMIEAIALDPDKEYSNLLRNILVHRSVQSMLRLLKIQHTPQCQYWAAWALAYNTGCFSRSPLTHTENEKHQKFCSLMKKEGGIEILKELLESPQTQMDIKKFASMIITECRQKDFDSPKHMDIHSDSNSDRSYTYQD
uniref:Zer-1-like protein n=1 Tax=Metapenaeus joyneri majanivirus TaxID=2984280 RepID=A0A9C7BZT3_9VIRU|nr:MAG: zer-1-like protein [Metapenaeus joyneri majanivirus]